MKGFALLSALAAAGLVSGNPTKRADPTPITIKGNAFYKGNDRFYIRGIDYQPGGDSARVDPLADEAICTRDIAWFKDLGVNTIRVYTVDNSADHTKCMGLLADAGIYLVLDVNNGLYSLNRAAPALSYNAAYLQSIFATVAEFAKYKNTLAFFSGNEVINEKGNEFNAPYIKAVTRDLRAFIKAQNLRAIPVGYSAADVTESRSQTALYMNCGPDEVRSDFFAFNDYSWCNSDFKTSGWDAKVKNFTDYGLPLFLSEYGCNVNSPRKFDEVKALMSKDMTGVYSGGIMYEYSWEESKYGIVQFDGTKGQGKVSKKGDGKEYDNFKQSLKDNPAPSGDGGANATSHSKDCPVKSSDWNVDPKLLPEMPKEAQKYMKDGAGKGPGLTGTGSQTAGDSGLSVKNVTVDGTGSSTTSSKDNAGAISGSSMVATLASVAVAVVGSLLL
ncbi:1,3-beta-glucanosyltransferase Gel1 [Cordyceps militaris CM01]|uniref:1,3-beta-glucanosyltransferase n=2 Tax=Cordyceps militaris TaxID=73501 RepID=G3JHV5_CORMM|nr:1,3-beta-glucanosyltransferase Gel1 [Cordyceps militaris CM01]ATY59194.1 1,3-beta-glucanosyltransferase Gel1 [Cordyceps militaris]EGX90961.1 1,3-beta-glucanosyltransferase Gel1 [Cordyceps militaris CM01]